MVKFKIIKIILKYGISCILFAALIIAGCSSNLKEQVFQGVSQAEKHTPQSNAGSKAVKPFIPVDDQSVQTGYQADFTQLQTDGQDSIVLDNRQNRFHVKVAVYYLNGEAATLARVCSIRSGDQFAINNLSPGKYDVRFRNLITGKCFCLAESISFNERAGQVSVGQNEVPKKVFISLNKDQAIIPISLVEFEPPDMEL